MFLNAGEALHGVMEEIHQFFQKDEFNLDFERSVTLYETALGTLDLENDGMDTFWRGYWDYFLFDYHLIEGDLTPLEYFQKNGHSAYPQLVNELCMGFLSIFTIEEAVDEYRYVCRDFLTGEPYYLSFSLEGEAPLEDRVMMGHVFYNRSMGMNYLQSYNLKPLARKRLLEVLAECRDWYDIQLRCGLVGIPFPPCPGLPPGAEAHGEKSRWLPVPLCNEAAGLSAGCPSGGTFSGGKTHPGNPPGQWTQRV